MFGELHIRHRAFNQGNIFKYRRRIKFRVLLTYFLIRLPRANSNHVFVYLLKINANVEENPQSLYPIVDLGKFVGWITKSGNSPMKLAQKRPLLQKKRAVMKTTYKFTLPCPATGL